MKNINVKKIRSCLLCNIGALVLSNMQSYICYGMVGPISSEQNSNHQAGSASNLAHKLLKIDANIEEEPENAASTQSHTNKDNEEKNNKNKDAKINGEKPTSNEQETIVVTGTHIRGAGTQVGSQLVTIGREDIERAGYSNIRDLSQFLPQNFGGGATGEFQVNNDSGSNYSQGSTFNLRGLGPSATLTLVNGRRLPMTGTAVSLADVSNIPLSAIERIEILPDGASAVYGSDAVAGVVNIILRKDFDGQEINGRFGLATEGDVHEYQVSYTNGINWNSGHLIFSYEFYRRGALHAADRSFTSSMDHTKYGGQDYRAYYGNPGNILDPNLSSILFSLPKNQNGIGLTRQDLLPPDYAQKYDYVADLSILPRQKRHSIYSYISQEISHGLEAFIEGRLSSRKHNSKTRDPIDLLFVTSDNPYYFDVFGGNQPVIVAYSFHNETDSKSWGSNTNYNISSGVDIDLPKEWSARTYISYSKDESSNNENTHDPIALAEAVASGDPSNSFNPFGHGAINPPAILSNILYVARSKYDSETLQANIVADGPVVSLLGNTIKAAVGADYRNNKFDMNFIARPAPSYRTLEREVIAIFGEIRIPIINPDAEIFGFDKLEISGSLRHERYEDAAKRPVRTDSPSQSTTDPRIGITWQTTPSLRVSGNYGTSFRAPRLDTMAAIPAAVATVTPDPSAPGGWRYVLLLLGTQDELKPETATTWTLGVDVTPELLADLKFSLYYFNIKFKNQISTPNSGQMLADAGYSELVTLNPSIEQIIRSCNSAEPSRRIVGPTDCTESSSITAILDGRTGNFARTHIDGIDFNISYHFELGNLGELTANLNTSYLFNYKQSATNKSILVERINTAEYPVDLRARGGLSWSINNDINISSFVNYVDNYKDVINDRNISSWTTFDITASFDMKYINVSNLLSNTVIQLSVQNLFNNDPPYYEHPQGVFAYDPANAEAIGRFIAVNIKKTW